MIDLKAAEELLKSPEIKDLAKETLSKAAKIGEEYLKSGLWPLVPDTGDASLDAVLARAEKLDAGLKKKADNREQAIALAKVVSQKALDIAVRAIAAGLL